MTTRQRFRTMLAIALCAVGQAATGLAQADIDESFNGPTLAAPWTTWDGYAVQQPQDTANHAQFQMTGTQLSISFPGGQEHNQWLLRHAQVLRAYPGSGSYEFKMDSSLTGTTQFGLTFQSETGTFVQVMLYATDQVHAYIERFVNINGQQYKATVAGQPLGAAVPDDGPYYVRVTLADDADPAERTWKVQWSRNGSNWIALFNGSFEGSASTENIGAIQQVGLFAGNQPWGFDGFDARFDYFTYDDNPAIDLAAPTGVIARGGNQQVDLWWAPVENADGYGVYVATTSGGSYSLLGTTTALAFTHSGLTNGTQYSYTITAMKGSTHGVASAAVEAVPHIAADLATLPTQGLLVALSASELAYTHANGEAITAWANALGPLIGATADEGRAPTFIASAINGIPAARFDGVDDFFSLPAGFTDFTAGMSAYVVMRPSALQTGFKILAFGNGASQQNIVLGRAGSTPGLQYFTDNASGSVEWFNTADGLVAGETSLVSVLQEAGTANSLSFAEVARNAEPLYGQNVWVPPVTTRAVNYIGKSYWSEGIFQGDVAEVLIYNRLLSPAEQLAVQEYVSDKYALSLDGSPPPPAPLAAPSDLVAVGDEGSVSLQWSAVSGATDYKVYRKDSIGGTYALLASVTDATHADTSVINGTTYYYVVTSHTTTEESVQSAQVFATPAPEATPDPTLPTAGLVLALDAASLATQFSDGASVTTWSDLSSSNLDAVAGAGAPTFVANAVGGKPAVRFDGVDDHFTLPAGFQDFTAGISLYVVMRPTTLQSGFKILALGNGASQQNIVLGRAGSTAGFQYFVDGNSDVAWFDTSSGLAAGETSLVSLLQEPGAAGASAYAEVGKNGIALHGANVYVPPVTARAVNYIGKSYWNEGMFQGDIAEILLYNRTLGTEEQAGVRSYVEQKYGITLP